MYAGYYPHPRPVDEVIDLVGLAEKSDERVIRLSGGQQRRLDVAIALAGRPGAAVPRRADDRLRPLGPARGLGGREEPGRARQDRAAHHPLHGRGPVPRRPGRGDRRGPDRRRGPSRDAGPSGPRRGPDPLPRSRRERRSRLPSPARPVGDGFVEVGRRRPGPDACTSSPGGRSTTGSRSTASR